MNKKSWIYITAILGIAMIIGAVNPGKASAQSLESVAALNENSTALKNNYGITGELLTIRQVEDKTFVLSKDGLYYISNGKAKKYTFDGTIADTASLQIYGQDIYISPISIKDAKDDTIYLEYHLNLDHGTKEISANYNDFFKKAEKREDPESLKTFTDKNNNHWFATSNYGTSNMVDVFCIDTEGNVNKVMSNREGKSNFLSFDESGKNSEDKTIFAYTVGNGINVYGDTEGHRTKTITIFETVDKDWKKTWFDVYAPIDVYVVGSAGDLWALSGNKTLLHLDKKGKRLAEIALKNGRDVSIDSKGDVYVLEDNAIKLVSKNKLITCYTLASTYRYHELSIIGKDKFIASSENALEIVNGQKKEAILSDAGVKYYPHIVEDNKGNITILSTNSNIQEDKDLKVYQIRSSGISMHNVTSNLGDYRWAVGYDGDIYIPRQKGYDITINILKEDMTTEKFITEPANLPLLGMQMDNKKNLYLLFNQMLIKVSSSKKEYSTDITDQKGGYKNQVIGLIKDKYGNFYIKFTKGYYYGAKNSLGLLKVSNNMKMEPVSLSKGNTYGDWVYMTSKNEVAFMSSNADNEKQRYILDSKGNAVRDLSFHWNGDEQSDLSFYSDRIWKLSDGSTFYEGYRDLTKKSKPENLWIGNIEQVLGDSKGRLFYLSDANVFVYDKKLPKVTTASPVNNQSKVALSEKMTFEISELVIEGKDFKNINLSENGSRISIRVQLVGHKLVITPKTKLKSKAKYTITIPAGSLKDIAQNSMEADYTSSFTTK